MIATKIAFLKEGYVFTKLKTPFYIVSRVSCLVKISKILNI